MNQCRVTTGGDLRFVTLLAARRLPPAWDEVVQFIREMFVDLQICRHDLRTAVLCMVRFQDGNTYANVQMCADVHSATASRRGILQWKHGHDMVQETGIKTSPAYTAVQSLLKLGVRGITRHETSRHLQFQGNQSEHHGPFVRDPRPGPLPTPCQRSALSGDAIVVSPA